MEKTLKVFNRMIHPDSLYKILKTYNKNNFLGLWRENDFVSCICLIDTNKKRLEDNLDSLTYNLINKIYGDKKLLIFDNDEINDNVDDIKKQLSNGIKEDSFIDWFMMIAFQLTQITSPLDSNGKVRENFLPTCESVVITHGNGELHTGLLFSATKSTLLIDGNINQFVDKALQISKDTFNNKNKKSITRKPLDSKLRHECFKRDNYKCKECGNTNQTSILHADHIIPVTQGGKDELSNLQTLCENCNLGKSNRYWTGGNDGTTN